MGAVVYLKVVTAEELECNIAFDQFQLCACVLKCNAKQNRETISQKKMMLEQ